MIIWNALLIALHMTLIGFFVGFSVKDKEAGKKLVGTFAFPHPYSY